MSFNHPSYIYIYFLHCDKFGQVVLCWQTMKFRCGNSCCISALPKVKFSLYKAIPGSVIFHDNFSRNSFDRSKSITKKMNSTEFKINIVRFRYTFYNILKICRVNLSSYSLLIIQYYNEMILNLILFSPSPPLPPPTTNKIWPVAISGLGEGMQRESIQFNQIIYWQLKI